MAQTGNDHSLPRPDAAETRRIVAIAAPLTAAYAAEMGMVITDMIIVGRLGSDELAAVGLTGDLFWILLLMGMGVIAMVGVIAAQCHGADDHAGVIEVGEQGMVIATVTSLPIMLGLWLLGPLLTMAQQDGNVVQLAGSYARALTFAVFPALWFVVLRNYVTALAQSAMVGWIMLIALLLNLLFNYALVFGRLGAPAMGVIGAGLSTTLVNWLMFLALALYLRRARVFAGLRPRLLPRALRRNLLRELLRLGAPNAATQMLNGAMFSAAALMVGTISATVLAAQQIVYTFFYLALSAAAALADAVRVRVAYGIGRRDAAAAQHSARICFALALITTLVAALPLLYAPDLLVRVFLDTEAGDNAAVLAIAVTLSLPASAFLILDGLLMVTGSAIKGLRDTISPLWISLIGYWLLGIGGGGWLCFSAGLGAPGLWWGAAAGVMVSNVLMLLRYRQRAGECAAALAEP
jgi:MATE family multidrug resistance protein